MAQTSKIPARITQAVDEKNLVVLRGNVHPLARPEHDQGAVADAQPLRRILLLLQRSPDQETALQKLLDDQQSKSSPNYHAWLPPEQFGQEFGPADADIQMVMAWLTSHGFTEIKVGPGRTVIEFSGNVAQVRNAFHTEIHRFLVNGEARTANVSDPQIPTALAPVVAGIVSLHNFPKKSHARILGQFRRTIGKAGVEPLFTFPSPFNGMNFYGLGPGDFATIYNTKPLIAAGNDGTGQTIAIVGETNINVQDVQQFRKMFGLPVNFDTTNVVLNGEDPGITFKDEEGEADLDVEWSGAVAPGATVKFVVSASTPASAGIDLSALYIVEKNLAGVMSESYGDCENALGSTGNAFYNSLWEQAAAQGITVLLSSGDGGSAGCDDFGMPQPATQGLAVSGLASTPFNVSVGGTDFDQVNNWPSYWNPTNDPTGTSAKSYIPEIPWSQNCAQIGLTGCGPSAPDGSVNIVAGSGGPSSVYGKPTWQIGVAGVPNDSHRDQPDVSLFASSGFNGTGYVYCQSDRTISGAAAACDLNVSTGILDFGIVGGTSVSAPAFAGIMALVNQYQPAHGGTNRQGNANNVLYALAKKPGASCTSSTAEAAGCIFNDVTKGSSFLPTGAAGVGTNSVPCQGGSLNCSVSTAGNTGVLVDPSHPTMEAWTAAAGYDMTTGLGTVNGNNLATNWGSVSTIPTTTTLTLSPTTGMTHGTAENVTVGITVKATSGTPTGDVSLIATLSDGTTQGLDQFTLANGSVTAAKTQSLPGGTYTVSAHYAGDGTNAPSDSSPVQVSVGKEGSQTFIVVQTFDSEGDLLNGNATSVTYGSRYMFRMYVTNSSAMASTTGPPSPTCYQVNQFTCPTGTVTLTGNGTAVDGGTFTLNNAGYTRDIAPALTGGTYSLVAQYSGDNSYNPNSGADSLTVKPAPTSIGQQLVVNNPVVGVSFGVNIIGHSQVLTAGVGPTGTVTFYDGTTQLGNPVPINGSPGGSEPAFFASATLTIATAGSHSLSAQYSGDANYAPSTTSTTVNVLNPTAAIISFSPSIVNYSSTVTITGVIDTFVSAANSALKPTGTITFNAGYDGQITNGVSITAMPDASGNWEIQATATITPSTSENFAINYSGDNNYEAAFASSFLTVIIPDFNLNIPSTPFNIPVGQPGTLQISVAPATNNSSSVTLSCNGNLPIGYSCSLQPSTLNLANGVTSRATLTLSPSPSGAAVIGSAVRAKHGRTFFFPLGSNPLWPVSLLSGLASLLSLCWAWKKRELRASLGFGLTCIMSLIIGCGGGSYSAPTPPPPGPFATSTTVSTSSAKIAQNAPVTFTAKVTGQGNPTGSVNFYASGSWIGMSNLTAGTASLNTPLAFPGVYSITAQYAGDSNNLVSTSAGVSESVTGITVMQVHGQTGTLFHLVNVTVTLQ